MPTSASKQGPSVSVLFPVTRLGNSEVAPREKKNVSACLVEKKVPKKCYSISHRILRYVYGALNVDEKKLIAQFGWKSRDERFEPSRSIIEH